MATAKPLSPSSSAHGGRGLDDGRDQHAGRRAEQSGEAEGEHHDPVDVDAHQGGRLPVVRHRLHRAPDQGAPLQSGASPTIASTATAGISEFLRIDARAKDRDGALRRPARAAGERSRRTAWSPAIPTMMPTAIVVSIQPIEAFVPMKGRTANRSSSDTEQSPGQDRQETGERQAAGRHRRPSPRARRRSSGCRHGRSSPPWRPTT